MPLNATRRRPGGVRLATEPLPPSAFPEERPALRLPPPSSPFYRPPARPPVQAWALLSPSADQRLVLVGFLPGRLTLARLSRFRRLARIASTRTIIAHSLIS